MFPKNVFKDFWEPFISIRGVRTPGLPSLFEEKDKANKLPAVPFPQVYTIRWTEPASTGNGACHFPPSDPDAITLPNPQDKPALYNAAIDTIRCSNDFFVKSGCGSGEKIANGHPTKEDLYDLEQAFMEEFNDKEYPNPPDLRTLCVTDKDYHPSSKKVPWGNRLWVVACKRFESLSADGKVTLLRKINAEQQEFYKRSFKDVKIYNDFLVEIFMKYLAHLEIDNRNKTAPVDVQPTEAELDAVFRTIEARDGITLYDLARMFYDAAEPRELVRRVQYFAKFVPNPSKRFSYSEIPEGRYFRKPIPSIAQIEAALAEPVTLPELFEVLARNHPEFASGVGSQTEVLERLQKIAAPDITTGRWLKKDTLPTEAAISAAMASDEILSLDDLIAHFPDQIASRASLRRLFESIAAPDLATGRYLLNDTLPTREEIEAIVSRYQIPSVDHIIPALPGKIASKQLFQVFFHDIATPDLSTGNYMAKRTPPPSAVRIHNAMMHLGGGPLSTREIAQCFPHEVACEASFVEEIQKAGYRVGEGDEGKWAPRWRQGDAFLEPESSRQLFGLEAQMKADPMRVLGWVAAGAQWDGNAFTDVVPESVPEVKSEEDPSDEEGVLLSVAAMPYGGASDGEGAAAPAVEVSQEEPEVIDLTSPPASPKRKRAMSDEGDEVGQRSDGSSRRIKKARSKKEE